MPLAHLLTTSDLRTDSPPDLSIYRLKLIAQGDSWFSVNKFGLFNVTSLLRRLNFSDDTVILNCAYPGDVLTHMVEWRRDPYFFRYFAKPRLEEKWDALLLSAAGNDLIDALQVLPRDADGEPRLKSDRLLLTRSERASEGPISRYVSPEGWEKFRTHMLEQYQALGAMRAGSVKNKDVPIFTHCYEIAQPRDVGTGFSGPWLYVAMVEYEVPEADWLPLSKYFIDRLHDEIITQTGLENFHVFDSRNMIPPAPINPEVRDPNWANEIHPTAKGYDLISPGFVELIESILMQARAGSVPEFVPSMPPPTGNGVARRPRRPGA